MKNKTSYDICTSFKPNLDNTTDSNSTDEENIQMVCVCKDMVFPGFLSGKQKLLIKDKRNIERFLS